MIIIVRKTIPSCGICCLIMPKIGCLCWPLVPILLHDVTLLESKKLVETVSVNLNLD